MKDILLQETTLVPVAHSVTLTSTCSKSPFSQTHTVAPKTIVILLFIFPSLYSGSLTRALGSCSVVSPQHESAHSPAPFASLPLCLTVFLSAFTLQCYWSSCSTETDRNKSRGWDFFSSRLAGSSSLFLLFSEADLHYRRRYWSVGIRERDLYKLLRSWLDFSLFLQGSFYCQARQRSRR